jgi:hypothetical protein
MTELIGKPSAQALGLMPHGTLGFEQTFVRIEVLRGKAWIEVFSILTKKGDEVLEDLVEGLIASRKWGAIGHGVESKILAHLGMLHQPAALGLEAKGPPLLPDDAEHD